MVRIQRVILVTLLAVSMVSLGAGPQPSPVTQPDAAWPAAGLDCNSAPDVPDRPEAVPADAAGSSQNDFNIFAWKEFIALNWVADRESPGNPDPNAKASEFGKANDPAPMVWESYKVDTDIFRPHAEPPLPWKSQQEVPGNLAAFRGIRSLQATSNFGPKMLYHLSKLAGLTLDLSEYQQAGTDGAWLTAQNGHLTLYEVRVNQDEYNYINRNRLYNAQIQQTFVVNPGINLPDGTDTSYGPTGAIEVKAAWIELEDEGQWPKFKISKAWVSYPIQGDGYMKPKLVTVGLVGLHIIHKTALGQQFVWATFEHVKNAPDKDRPRVPPYTYNNGEVPGPSPNVSPTRAAPYDRPIQVERTYPISDITSNPVRRLNRCVQDKIKAKNPDSVFQYYELVNVLWPQANTPIGAGARVPLPQGNPQPPKGQMVVANTTLETYFQSILSCLDCHSSAPIATISGEKSRTGAMAAETAAVEARAVVKIYQPRLNARAEFGVPGNPAAGLAPYASNYSFLFQLAQTPAP